MGEFTSFGLMVFWIFVIGAGIFAYLWIRTHKRRTSQAPRLYMEALRALVDGDDLTAFDRLKMTVNEDSNNLDAYLKLGDLLRRRGRIDRAIRVHGELRLRPNLNKASIVAVQRSLALDYLAAGDWPSAEAALNQILEVDKENAWATEQLVGLYAQTGRFEEAFATRKAALKRAGKSDGHQLAIYKTLAGVKRAAEGHKHEARVQYKEALGYDETCIPALLYLGDAYWEDGRPEDALEWWTRLTNLHPEVAHLVFSRLERAYFELGQYGEINLFYERLLEKNPNHVGALIGLADLAFKKCEHESALRRYRQVLEIDPGNLSARAGIISTLSQMDRWRQVAEEVGTLLDSPALGDTGFVCTKCGHRERDPAWYCPKCKALESFNLGDAPSVTTKT